MGVLQWSDTVTLEIPLTVIDGEETVGRLAAAIQAIAQVRGGTQPGDGLRAGTEELLDSGREDTDWFLCMSTDGVTNGGESLASATAFARDAAVDRYSVVAVEDPDEGFDAAAAQGHYGPHVFGGGTVTVARNTAEFASLIISGCLNPALELVGLEVNQAVQDWNNSVRLIEGKAAVVRAFVQTLGDEPVRTTGRLFGTRDGVELPGNPLPPDNPGASVLARQDVAARRGVLADSLNFSLPPAWSEGPVDLRLELPGGLICSEASPPAGDCSASVVFEPGDVLQVEFVDVTWENAGGALESPSDDELEEQAQRMRQTLPYADVDATYSQLADIFSSAPDLDDVNAELAMKQLVDGCIDLRPVFPVVCDRLYYGVLRGDGGGLADGIPGFVASGYLDGAGEREDTGSARNTAPHEVAHNLGRHHSVAEANGLSPDGFKQGWCNEFADADAPDYPYVAEIGGLPFPTLGPLGRRDAEIWGFDTRFGATAPELAVIDPRSTFALMSYCEPFVDGQGAWVDEFTYRELRDAISDGLPANDRGFLINGTLRILRGRIDLAANTVRFDPFVGFTTETSVLQPPAGEYSLELLDGSGQVIDTIPFEPRVSWTQQPPEGGGPPVRARFLVPVSDPGPSLRRVIVRHAGVEIGSITASATAPTVTVIAPAEGDALTGDTVTLEWSGQDADGDALTYTVQYSADDGARWNTLAVDLAATTLAVDRSAVAGSATARFRVLASDGVNTATATSGRFSVGDSPPRVFVDRPRTGQEFSGVQQILLNASAWDPEDGQLSGSAIAWSSDLDGPLGNGVELVRQASDLTEGTHVVTATATDSAGNTGTANVTIRVVRVAGPPPVEVDVTPPVVMVPEPVVVDATSPEGAAVDYVVTATDETDRPRWSPVTHRRAARSPSAPPSSPAWRPIAPATRPRCRSR